MTKILFVSRAYPPVVGGIENQNYELATWLSKITDVKKVINIRGKKFLPVFLPYAKLKSLISMRKNDVILLGDGVLAPVGYAVKIINRKPAVCVLHGLDLTYKNFIYQKLWVGFFMKKLDKFICVGQETLYIAKEKGLPEEKLVFIPNGVDTEKYFKHCEKSELEKILDIKLEDKKVILTSGRLAKRKGVAWFCEHVMPNLSENYIYIVAGDGADRKNIEEVIKNKNLSKRIKMLGYVTDEVRNILFNTCDIFVQPNTKVLGDMEGFGISVIEAASCQLPVIAANLEGLKDAIKNGGNGFLVESGNASAWVEKINEVLADDNFRREFGQKARQYVIENYSWGKISRRYLEEIEKTL
ncbi:MAG TPA: glycosyltransferase family 4 protein [Candidatus Moranbacteria bacterium]|nr:glycosyltransferase family 4 protein [Candidatus Moranbacteria bacterium]